MSHSAVTVTIFAKFFRKIVGLDLTMLISTTSLSGTIIPILFISFNADNFVARASFELLTMPRVSSERRTKIGI